MDGAQSQQVLGDYVSLCTEDESEDGVKCESNIQWKWSK